MAELERLVLHHPHGRSDIVVGAGALRMAAAELDSWCQQRRIFLISSAPVMALFEARVRRHCSSAAVLEPLSVPDGESAKSIAVAEGLWREMLRRGGKRDSRLLTLGGGSVGDLGGFVAGCFLRGIEFSQIPTTLLAQVDASIGGKTGVDLPEAKNSVGAFHYAALVLADTELLSSLPAGELRSGLIEVIKMAVLLDPDLLLEVEDRLEDLLAGDADALARVVVAAIRAKIRVVEADPEERDCRRLLNFGHTLGHALEAVLKYQGLRHGEAVGYGILFALRLADRRGLGKDVRDRLRGLLDRLGLPNLPSKLAAKDLLAAMQRDKKATERGPVWVLAAGLGEGRLDDSIGWSEIETELENFLSDPLS